MVFLWACKCKGDEVAHSCWELFIYKFHWNSCWELFLWNQIQPAITHIALFVAGRTAIACKCLEQMMLSYACSTYPDRARNGFDSIECRKQASIPDCCLREACLCQNGWIFVKFPKGGGVISDPKNFIAICFALEKAILVMNFRKKLRKGGGSFPIWKISLQI